ncbi:MAG: hypothetical protein IIX54_01915 [Clostridia bacterium]|nr:hypothetical protein [Clostridia bacterium]
MLSFVNMFKKNNFGRSVLSVILAVAVLCSTLSMVALIPTFAEYEVWDGTTQTAPVDSDSDGVYEITNADELAYVVYNDGTINGTAACSFILTDDIYINDPSKVNWTTGEAIGSYTINSWFRYWKYGNTYSNFSGTIDGDGHTVYGLYFKNTTQGATQYDAAALIPGATGNVVIENLGVDNAYVNYTNGVSAFVGYATNDTVLNISNSFAGANVTLIGNDAGVFRAVARNNVDCVLENCYSLATTTGTKTYGLIGFNWDNTKFTFKNCYNATGPLNFGGGPGWYCVSQNSYAISDSTDAGGGNWLWDGVTVITADKMQGQDVFTDAAKMPNLNLDGVYEATDTYPVLKIFVKAVVPAPVVEVWDGTTQTAPVDSDSDGVYEITNAEELAYVVYNDGTINGNAACSFILTNDIYINDINKVNWATGEAIGSYTINSWFRYWKYGNTYSSFAGTIDGDGHIVYGLYFKNTEQGKTQYDAAALIPGVKGTAVIKNLGVDNAYVNYSNGASAFVGYALTDSTVNISNSFAGANVTIIGNDAGVFRAVARDNINCVLENCYSLANTVGSATYGLIGFNWEKNSKFTFKNCYNANGPLNFGGGPGWYCVSENSYATADSINAGGGNWLGDGVTVITADNMKGQDVFSNTAKMPNLNTNDVYEATSGYPILKLFKQAAGNEPGDDNTEVDIWDGTTTTAPAGNGTQASPYLITNGAELAYIISNGGGADTYYKLTADIYLNDIAKIDWATGNAIAEYTPNTWYDNVAFQGNIDGDGHVVYGLYFKTPSSTSWSIWGNGLVPKVAVGASVSITKLGVDKSYISGKHGVSAFVGCAGDNISTSDRANVTIDQCYVGANVTLKGHDVGAFRGTTRNSNTTIKNSYSLATIIANGSYGLVGSMWTVSLDIDNCYIVGAGVTTDVWSAGVSNIYATQEDKYTGEVEVLTAENMKGTSALTNMPNLNTDDVFVATDSYPVLKVFVKEQDPGENPDPGEDPDPGETPDPGPGEQPGGTVTVPDYVWDGTEVAPTEGDGSSANPYLIKTAEELAYIIANGGGANTYYKIVNDIYLNATEYINWETGAVTNGYTARSWYDNVAFQGIIDGDGHTVHGLYYDAKASASWSIWGNGLIPRVAANTTVYVSKLGIDNAYVSGKHGVSAFVGCGGDNVSTTDSTRAKINIDRCFVGANVVLKGYDVGAFRGATRGSDTVISNSYTLATLNGTMTGIVGGETWDASVEISNTYNAKGKPTSQAWHPDYSFLNVYVTDGGNFANDVTVLTADQMKGTDALTNMANINADNAFIATDSYPVINFAGGTGPVVPDNPSDETVTVPDYVWDRTEVAPTKGDGSKKNPYLIGTAEELAYVIANGGGQSTYYKLTADIYLNAIEYIDWATGEAVDGYVPRTWYDNVAFQGTINGDGYMVYGLYFKTTKTAKFGYWGEGLIPRVNPGTSATVTKLGVDYAYVSSENAASAFVGFAGATSASDSNNAMANVSIDKCFVGANTTIKGWDVGAFRGGTRSSNTSIVNAYSLATLDGGSTKGLIGNIWDASVAIENAYNANGAIVSDMWLSNIDSGLKNVYATDKGLYVDKVVGLTTDNMQGLDVFTNEAKMPNINVDDAFVAQDGYPVLKVFTDLQTDTVVETPGQVWTGTIAEEFAQGEGTEDDPYIISTAAELAYAVKYNGFGGKYFELSHDIFLNDISNKLWYRSADCNEWFADSAGFNGHIDGKGHIVYGIWYPNGNKNKASGLIPVFMSGTIKNIGVRNAQINAEECAGGIVGKTVRTGMKTVESCFVDETVFVATNHTDYASGGIVGMAYDTTNAAEITLLIKNCYSKASLSGMDDDRKNGILGGSWRTPYSIINCYSVGYPVYNAQHAAEATSAFWNYHPSNDAEAKNEIRDKNVQLTAFIYNNYSDVGVINQWTNQIVIADATTMRGDAARTSMPELDYVNVYQVVEGGTPKLKIFTTIDGKDIFSSQDADFFGAGRGSMDDPFIIRTAEHLRYVVESLDTKGKYYKLGNDIYVNDTTDPNWMNNNPATWYSEEHHHSFAGHFDGAGYKIYGLYVNEESPKYQGANYKGTGKEAEWINHGTGLFPYIDPEASVRNTHIRNSYLAGKGTVGGIAGNLTLGNEAARLQIIACSVDETVTLKGFTVGGLIGASHTRGIDLTYCYGSAKMSNTGPENRVSGLVGDIWGAKLSAFEAYTTEYQVAFGSLVNTTALYGPVDQFGVTVLNKSDMIGAKAKNNMKFTWDKVWYTVDGKTPQLNVVKYGEEESLYDEGVEGRVWSGKVANNFGGGSGTKEDPYLIYTPEQMARIFALQSDKFTYYKLMADLKLNNTSKENWEDNAKMWYAGDYTFRGEFDGNGHVVSGLYYKNENNTDYSKAGLFQKLGHSSTIKKLGVTNSTVINNGPIATYAAAICAYLEHWAPEDNKDGSKKVPQIIECFGSDSVYLEANAVAGILAATQTEVIIKNCYFTGELTGATYSGAMVADNWAASGHGPTLINCYAATLDADPLGDGYGDCGFNDDSVANKRTFITDCYIAGSSRAAAITPISVMYMKGADAKKYMPKLDFKNVWMTVNGGTPVLRCFGSNASKYSSTRNPKEVVISFGNLGDAVVEPLRGYPGYTPISKDELPVPERRGFIFNGWHHFNPDGCEFELELFPNYDITLYANWTEVGFTQNFDKELNEQYDYNEGIEIFKPGLAHYNTKYVHSGWRSLHTLKDSSVDPEFLVSYEDTLLVGYEYEISFWMTTDTDGTSGKLYFEQSNYGDVNDEIVGYQEALTFSDLKDGEWKQYTVKIVANAPYLIVRAEKGTSLYFEDFEGIPTGAKGELGNLLGYNPGAAGNGSGLFGLAPWLVAIIIGGAVLVLGGAAVVVIVVTKKKA